MSDHVPWWLGVTVGWVIMLGVGIGYSFIAVLFYFGYGQMSYEAFNGACLRLLGGAVITMVMCIVIGVCTYLVASARSGGCAFAIATSLLLLLLLLLFLARVLYLGAVMTDPHPLRTPTARAATATPMWTPIARLAAATPVQTGAHVGKKVFLPIICRDATPAARPSSTQPASPPARTPTPAQPASPVGRVR